jgi:glucan phosphoethanolaminetransferase (alkaline phosphatase superfamily)
MTLNTVKSVINLKIMRRTSIILFLAFLILTYVAKIIKYPLFGLNQTAWTIIVVFIFLLIIFLPAMLNYQYIYFSDEGENIIIRYYTTGIIPGNKNSVEINKRTFSGFTLDKRFFGLIQSITLYQRFKEGVAKYPPIYINALKREDKARIVRSLNLYAPKIKGKTPGNMS